MQGSWTEEELATVFGRLHIGDGCGAVLAHPLTVESAYCAVASSEPPYTSSVSQGMKTVDYMLFTPDAIKCRGSAGAATSPHDAAARRGAAEDSSGGAGRAGTLARNAEDGGSEMPGVAAAAEGAAGAAGGVADRAGGCGEVVDLCEESSRESVEGDAGGGRDVWQLRACAVLMPPPERAAERGMPTAELPSDHVSLVVQFAIHAGT